jgi:hypothetical protein
MRKALLLCGVVSSIVYLSADAIGSLRWAGYSYLDQTISELAALESPSRPLVMGLFIVYDILLIAFASGVSLSATDDSAERRAANAIRLIGWFGVLAAFFPIRVRGSAWTINETIHVLLTTMTVFFIVGAIVFGSKAAGRKFRAYSIATIVLTLGFGAWSGWIGRGLAADLPTPWIGVAERICVYSYLAWIAVFAVVLLRAQRKSGKRHVSHRPKAA